MATLEPVTLEFNLDEIYKEIDKREDKVLECLYDEIWVNTPVRTGALRDSTFIDYDNNTVGQTKEYGPYVEYRQGYFSKAVLSALAKCKQIWQE